MKQLKLLACALALASFAILTGCGDNNNAGDTTNNNPPPAGTNAPAASALVGKTIALGNASADTIKLVDATTYTATFGGAAEDGTYTYTKHSDGNSAVLALTPSSGGPTTATLTFDQGGTSGTYSIAENSETGNFTVQ
jgi:hypothetical protein